jgi:hypothetical protein
MRDMQKFMRDQRNGELASRRYAVSKTLETCIISRTISRAMRRGRISPDTARRCAHNWVAQQNARPAHVVWSRVAASELVRVGVSRRRGDYDHARYLLKSVRDAIRLSHPLND